MRVSPPAGTKPFLQFLRDPLPLQTGPWGQDSEELLQGTWGGGDGQGTPVECRLVAGPLHADHVSRQC